MCETFFATLECELLDHRRFESQAEAEMAIFEFIVGLVQPASPAFVHRLLVTRQLREEDMPITHTTAAMPGLNPKP